MRTMMYLCAGLTAIAALSGCASANGGAGPDWDAAAANWQNFQNSQAARRQPMIPMQRQTVCNSYRTGAGIQTICQ